MFTFIYLSCMHPCQPESQRVSVISAIVHQALLCFAGEGIMVVASIQNKSSREIRPKYCIYRKYSFFAKKKRKVETKSILKEVGDAIPPSSFQTVTRFLSIPPTSEVSILNCSIIKVEYRLKVCISLT